MWYKLKRATIRVNGVEKQVRPSGWKPWANTIYYLPFDTDLLDHSWNGYTFTPSWWNISIVSWEANIPVCYINNGSLDVPSSTYTFGSDDFTVSYWVNIPTDQFSIYRWVVWFNGEWGSFVLNYEFNGGYIWSWLHSWNVGVSYPTVKDTWIHFVTVRDGGTFTTYYNWNQYDTQTVTPFSVWQGGATVFGIGRWQGVVMKNLYISNFILESKARTAQEISDYYNQTKWNYGL